MSKQQTIKQQIEELAVLVSTSNWDEVATLHGSLTKRRLNDKQLAEIEELMADVPESEYSMAKQISKYRERYVTGVTPEGKKSLNNGDPVALFLEGKTWEEVCGLADVVFEEAGGTHAKKYAKLNPGQRRMNAGNRIRAAVKRGDWQLPA